MSNNVLTGLEGLLTPQVLQQRRESEHAKRALMEGQQLKGTDLAARIGGRLFAKSFLKMAGVKDHKANKAQTIQDAIDAGEGRIADETFEGPTADIDKRISTVRNTIIELQEKGLGTEANQLKANMVVLQQQRLQRRKDLADLTDTEVTTSGKKLDQTFRGLEIKQKQGEAPGRDEVTRLLNQIDELDPNDPADAVRIDASRARVAKLTTITGTTEFDPRKVSDKKMWRQSLEELSGTRDALDRLRGVEEAFDPDFLTLGGKIENFGIGIRDMLDLPLSEGERKQFADYKSYAMRTNTNLNLYIKDITGAQMSENEAARLIEALPNQEDSPAAFQAKLDEAILELTAANEKAFLVAQADAKNDKQASIAARNLSTFDMKKRIRQERKDQALLEELGL
jgi:hypothetical protein